MAEALYLSAVYVCDLTVCPPLINYPLLCYSPLCYSPLCVCVTTIVSVRNLGRQFCVRDAGQNSKVS